MKFRKIALFLLLFMMLAGTLFPLAWMFYSSLLPKLASLSRLADLFGQPLTLQNYKEVFQQAPFGRFFFNSVLVAAAVTLGNLLFCSMVGYALARKVFRFKKGLLLSVVLVLMVPAHILIIPLFILINKLGWYDTYWALIVPWLVNPLGIFLMRQMMEKVRFQKGGRQVLMKKAAAPRRRAKRRPHAVKRTETARLLV